jgi:lipopolysaccharide transport system permease protein
LSNRTIIRPGNSLSFNLREWWHYRELFYFFTWRDIKVKYRQTYLGILWVVLQPLLLLLLFRFVFSSRLAREVEGVSYEVYLLSGLSLWFFFQGAVSQASDSLLRQAPILSKIYFPRVVLPVAAVLGALVDLLILLTVLLLFCLYNQTPLDPRAAYLIPLAILLALLAALALSLFTAIWVVRFRDIRHMVPFALQLMLFASTVLYASNGLPDWLRMVMALNPLHSALALMRLAFGIPLDGVMLTISLVSLVLLSFAAIFSYRKTEGRLADLV